MKRILLLALGLLALGTTAVAQVNVVPAPGLITGTYRYQTYSAVAIGLATASSATDIFCISGSSTKNIRVTRIGISGVAGTLTSVPVTLLHRVSLDTGGTAATTTANPANTLGKNNSTNATATATLISYTANPTIVDTSPTYARTGYVNLGTVAAATSISYLNWVFGLQVDTNDQGAEIPSGKTAEQWCLNQNASTISSGLLDIDIEWVEF